MARCRSFRVGNREARWSVVGDVVKDLSDSFLEAHLGSAFAADMYVLCRLDIRNGYIPPTPTVRSPT